MLTAFTLAFRQLRERSLLVILAQSLAVTLLVFAGLGGGLYLTLGAVIAAYLGASSTGLVALLTLALAGAVVWVTFRAVAVAVIGLFGDAAVQAVEQHYYPAALTRARPVPFGRALAMGLRSVLRLIGYNLLATPLYVVAAATGVGLSLAFFALNGWLLGRDLGDMVAARHLDPAQLDTWRAQTRGQRFAAGLATSGLFVVPGLNFVAPLIGAAAMTHLFHRGRAMTTTRS